MILKKKRYFYSFCFFENVLLLRKLRRAYAQSADFFSTMYQLRASTSMQAAASNNNSVERANTKRKIVKCIPVKWYTTAGPRKPTLTHETLKNQIGNCSICCNLPKPDIVQLPVCLCIFCRDCFYKYLDCFGRPNPVVQKAWFSRDPSDYKKWDSKKFAGFFDSALLSSDGTVLPKSVPIPKPHVLKSALDFDNRNSRRRTRKIPDDQHWYRIVKNESFYCPNCHDHYDNINRSDLKRNRVVSDILQKMLENEPGKNDNISTDQQGISS